MSSLPKSAFVGNLDIGDLSFPCSVLSDGTRILTQTDFMEGMGMYYSGWIAKNRPAEDIAAEIPLFLSFRSLKPFIEKHLSDLQITVKYRTEGGHVAKGIKAEIIPKICEVWLDADEQGVLGPRQRKIAKNAKILIRGLAYVGIVALVDEATGYQQIRAERALAVILEKFIATELQPWTRTFPYEFYKQIFRLKGWPGPHGAKRPSVIGHYTNDFVYKRLAPGVLERLQNKNPVLPTGSRSVRHHQWFTPDIGHPKLKEHLAAVIALMRAAPSWESFKTSLDRAFPKHHATIPLPFEDN